MKVKIGKLFGAKEIFNRIFSSDMDVKLAYRLSKISKKVNQEVKDIEEQRVKLVNKYADVQTEEDKKNGVPVQVKSRMEEFVIDFGSLLETEEEIDIQKIPIELLLESGVKMSSNDFITIQDFIEGEVIINE